MNSRTAGFAPLMLLLALLGAPASGAQFPAFDQYLMSDTTGNKTLGQTALVDIDRDGDLDWMVGDYGTAYWLEYQAPGSWVRHVIGTNPLADVGGAAMDVDGDGWIDKVTSGAWFRNPGNPRTAGNWPRYAVGGIQNNHDCVAADVDGDGRLDIVAMSDSGGCWWYRIPANPTQPWIAKRIGDGVHGGLAPRGVGDINGDGMPDVMRSTGWFENVNHGAAWTWHGNIPGGHGGQYPDCTRSWLTDLDRDGDIDVVMSAADVGFPTGTVRWFENADGKGLSWREHAIANGKGDLHTLALADFDRDGDLDIFSGDGPNVNGTAPGSGANGAYRWFVWENLDGRGGSWSEHVVYEGGSECHEGMAGDVDGDGAIDICTKPWTGTKHIFLKNRPTAAVTPPVAPGGLGATALSWSQIHLAWSDNSANETGFKIEEATAASGPWTQIAVAGANATAYDRGGLGGSTTRWYRLRATNTAGDSAYTAVASATTAAPPTTSIPLTGLAFWVAAGNGVTGNGAAVSQWADQSGNGRHAAQATASSQPVLVTNALGGNPVVRFDGADDFLQFTLPINGLTGMTMVLVGAAAVDRDGGTNGGNHAPLFWEETASWGWTFLSPFQSRVKLRFGTTQSGNLPVYTRPSSIGGAYSLTIATHGSGTDALYVDGTRVWSAGGKLAAIAGTTNTPYLGRGANATRFTGDLAEVLVYDRALGDADRQSVETYLRGKYFAAAPTYALTVTNGTGGGAYLAGAQVAITANAAPTGQVFDAWVVNGGSPAIANAIAASTTLTMPAAAVGVTATYKTDTSAITLPSPWSSADIGSVALAGSASVSGGTWTVSGSGADIWGTADAFRFVSQPLTGDGSIVARVVSLANTSAWAKAGVMIRQGTAAGATHAFCCATAGNGIAFQRRTATGGTSIHTAGSPSVAPRWVKLTRQSTTLTGYESADGITWMVVGSVTISMANPVQIGLAVTSQNNGVLCTAVFDQVQVIPGGSG